MGPKLFAAFGAGALFASAVLFFASRSDNPVPAPAVPPVQPASAPAPEPVVQPEPPKPQATPAAKPRPVARPASRTKEKLFRAAVMTPRTAPQARPVTVDATLPSIDAAANNDLPTALADLPPRPIQSVTLKEGTLLQVRLGERLASDRNVTGDSFVATLDQPLVADGWVIAERGARVLGRVVDAEQAGRVQGVASIALVLDQLTTTDGQKIKLRTASFVRKGDTSRKEDAVKVGVGAAIGAAIGAAVGGGKGAAVGAASGGAAGAGAVVMTRGKPATLESETRLSFRLDSPVTITER